MFGAFVVMAALGAFMGAVLAVQLGYAVLLKILNPGASWKRCLRRAGWT